jgi:hypothetical protein
MVSLEHYRKFSQARRSYEQALLTQLNSGKQARFFTAMKLFTANRKLCRTLLGDVTLKKHVAKKQFIFESWVDTAFDFARARGFRELKLK